MLKRLEWASAGLRLWPDHTLTTPCEDVDPLDAALAQICGSQLLASMTFYDGVGMAAPQLGILKRVFVISPKLLPLGTPYFFINPEVNAIVSRKEDMAEGCLSLPGKRANIRRFPSVELKADNLDVPIRLHGLAAQVAQHECDHLRGRLLLARRLR